MGAEFGFWPNLGAPSVFPPNALPLRNHPHIHPLMISE